MGGGADRRPKDAGICVGAQSPADAECSPERFVAEFAAAHPHTGDSVAGLARGGALDTRVSTDGAVGATSTAFAWGARGSHAHITTHLKPRIAGAGARWDGWSGAVQRAGGAVATGSTGLASGAVRAELDSCPPWEGGGPGGACDQRGGERRRPPRAVVVGDAGEAGGAGD